MLQHFGMENINFLGNLKSFRSLITAGCDPRAADYLLDKIRCAVLYFSLI